MAQVAELNQSHDEIIVALAQLQQDHDPIGPLATHEHDLELTNETRALPSDDKPASPADMPVANVAAVDAQHKMVETMSAHVPASSAPVRPKPTSAWFVPQPKRRWRMSTLFSTVLLAATALSASAGVAPPPVPTSSSGHIEPACFSGKALARALGRRIGSPDFFRPYVPQGAQLRSCIVDSGCSINMFSEGSQFGDLVKSSVVLQTADKRNHKVSSEGDVTLRSVSSTGDVRMFHIGRTLYTPSMHNLLSCCGVVDQGGVVHLEQDNSYIKLRDNTVFPVRRKGRLYYLDYLAPKDSASKSKTSSCSAGRLPRAGFYETPTRSQPPGTLPDVSPVHSEGAMHAPQSRAAIQGGYPGWLSRVAIQGSRTRPDSIPKHPDRSTSSDMPQSVQHSAGVDSHACASLTYSRSNAVNTPSPSMFSSPTHNTLSVHDTLRTYPHFYAHLAKMYAIDASAPYAASFAQSLTVKRARRTLQKFRRVARSQLRPEQLALIARRARDHLPLATKAGFVPSPLLAPSPQHKHWTNACAVAPPRGMVSARTRESALSSSSLTSTSASEAHKSQDVADGIDVEAVPIFDAPISGPSCTWHRRCCHFNPARINASVAHTHGLRPVRTTCSCAVCRFSKQHASPVPPPVTVRMAAHEPLSQVSVDLADMGEASLSGARYMIVFVDTYSRYTWVSAITKKSDAYICLQKFVAEVGQPREILSDYGSEFAGRFSALCLQLRIRMRKSAPYSPFQNGIVERANRTLKEAIRSMLLDAGGPASWWARAAVVAADTHNRLVNSYTPTKTPYELMWGVRPSLEHIRVFGSVCYPLIVPASRRKDLSPLKYPSSVGVYLGQCEHGPGVVVLDPVSQKLTVRRDVVVDENWRFKGFDQGTPTLHHVNPASIQAVPYPTDLLPVSVANHVPPRRLTHVSASRYAIDLCAGTSSALRYHLEADSTAQVLAIDILPYHKVVSHIPRQHRNRFHYRQIDVTDLSLPTLQKILYDLWSVSIDCIDHWHASVPCQSYSTAHHGNNFHRDGLRPLTPQARQHDAILTHTIAMLREIATINPRTLISVENPTGLFQSMPAVVECAESEGWLMLPEVHYCANTSEQDGVFPKKPTTFLLYGVEPAFTLPQCNLQCPHRLSGTSVLHKHVLCRHPYTHADQVVITDVYEKGKIPTRIFDEMWYSHRSKLKPPVSAQSSLRPVQPPTASSESPPPKPSVSPKSVVKSEERKKKGKTNLTQSKLQFAPALSAIVNGGEPARLPVYILPKPDTPVVPHRRPVRKESDPPTDKTVRVASAPSNPSTLARVQYLSGHTFDDMYGFKYWTGKKYATYGLTAFRYDVANGYLMVGKAPQRVKVTAEEDEEFSLAMAEALDVMHSAFQAQIGTEPQTYRQARLDDQRTNSSTWADAERVEIRQLNDLGTFETVDTVPDGETIFDTKFVYKCKPPLNGALARNKARIVVRNFKNDLCEDVFAPVCRVETLRMLMSTLSEHTDWDMHHVDICNAFCTAPLEKPMYIRPPQRMLDDDPGLKGKFVKVHNALYGRTTSPRAFNKHLHSRLQSYGYNVDAADPSLYVRRDERGDSFVLTYVDDLLFVGCHEHRLEFQRTINIDTNPENGFKVRDYGIPDNFLGIEITRNGHHVQLSQTQYIRSMAERFNITRDSAPATPLPPGIKLSQWDADEPLQCPTEFRAMVGSLMYAVHCTRCDCAQAVHALSRYLHAPRQQHVKMARGVIAYCLRFDELGLHYNGTNPQPLTGYSDADWAGDVTTRRSTSGYVFLKNGAAVSWSSCLQKTVAHSTSDAEYRALSESARECAFLRNLDALLSNKPTMDPTVIFEDNKGAKKWAEDPSHHSKTKHIEICFHSVREKIGKMINVVYCQTKSMLADPFTKPLAAPDFSRLFKLIFGSRHSPKPQTDIPSRGDVGPDVSGGITPKSPKSPKS